MGKDKLPYAVNYKKKEYKGMTKKEVRAAEAAKQSDWQDKFTAKQRAKDAEKAKATRKLRAKEEKKVSQKDRNMERYQVWGGNDRRTMDLMERYDYRNEGRSARADRGIQIDPDSPHATKKEVRPSDLMRNAARPASYKADSFVYTPKVDASPLFKETMKVSTASSPSTARKVKPVNRSVPKAEDISNGMVQLRYENEVCYWPLRAVKRADVEERFKIVNCYLTLASAPITYASGAAVKLKPLPDGRFNIKSGGTYRVQGQLDPDAEDGGAVPGVPEKVRGKTMRKEAEKAEKEKKKKGVRDPDAEPTPEEVVMDFLTLQKFVRGSAVASLEAKQRNQMLREESLEFTEDMRFTYLEFKGFKGERLQKTMEMGGKFKLKNNFKKVVLVFDKLKSDKKKEKRVSNKLVERQVLYASFHMVGNGLLVCTADAAIRFK